MNLTERPKPRTLATLLLPAAIILSGTVCGAQTSAPAPTATGQPGAQASNPELDNADHRVTDAKAKLDMARKQLTAIKAMVRAAEAEFRAAKADRDAIALRANAQQLADASGFPATTITQDGRQIIVPSGGGARLTPVDQSKLPVAPAALTPNTTYQSLDFNAQPPSAPAPDNDLRPSLSEPSSVP